MKSIIKRIIFDKSVITTQLISSLTPLLFTLLTALVFSVSAPVFAKDYTRSCTATYNLSARTPGGTRLRGEQRSFQGKGTIGYYNPNKARERARRNIDECITRHWETRNASSKPSQCTESNKVYNYPFNGLHFGIQQALCVRNPGRVRIIAGITVTYDGQTGCTPGNRWMRTVATNHTINCPTREVEQNTDRPVMDYRHFNLPALGNSELCRNRCISESRCRAWTYVKPHGRTPPVCWLKSGVPSPRPDRCCVSGVKTDLH